MNGSIERMDESEMESSPNRRTRTGRLMPFPEMIGRFKMNMLHYPRLEQYRWVDVKPSEGRCASDGFQQFCPLDATRMSGLEPLAALGFVYNIVQ
ncbi:Uncharacterized protein HZ326_6984 [Fusarium oxysporum f. sp. albedinis]|nr:Uncharacterized protein HZ326_6984 [Fusarium oxysporum f. sp. albedinis]